MKQKTCSNCGEEKALDQFARDRGGKHGRRSECRTCINTKQALALHALPSQAGCHPVIQRFLVGA